MQTIFIIRCWGANVYYFIRGCLFTRYFPIYMFDFFLIFRKKASILNNRRNLAQANTNYELFRMNFNESYFYTRIQFTCYKYARTATADKLYISEYVVYFRLGMCLKSFKICLYFWYVSTFKITRVCKKKTWRRIIYNSKVFLVFVVL